MLTFYHSPQSCSNGILLLLHEVGAVFETKIVDVRAGDQRGATYLGLNPKGKVPALGLADVFPQRVRLSARACLRRWISS